MADLEEHAFRRDKSFVVRLVLMLALAFGASVFVYAHLTGSQLAGCAADAAVGSGTGGRPH